MFECSIKTEHFKYEPVWTSGCQSEPDEYECVTLSSRIENKLTVEQVQDTALKVFLNIVLENPKVESLCIQTFHSVSYWPDEYGGTKEIKTLECKKNSENKIQELTVMGIKLGDYPGYTRDGIRIAKEDITPLYWKAIEDNFSTYRRQMDRYALHIEIFERKE
jgi:hypothetical protein